jgi:NAD(P)-dependent dehydrogenase (short-subunit alcohol dehydrogenase family)
MVANEVARQWMFQNGGGNIVMVGSITAMRPVAGSIAYLAAKAGLEQMTKTLALEWGT